MFFAEAFLKLQGIFGFANIRTAIIIGAVLMAAYELIEKFNSKVISDFEVDMDEIIANHYVQSEEYEDIFIRK